MAFKDYLTSEGERMMAKAASGTQINFTKVVIGSGYMASGAQEKNMTAVITPIKTLDVEAVTLNSSNTAVISTSFTNQDIQDGFYLREKGIYISDGTEEVLGIYGNAGSDAEYIDTVDVSIISKNIRTVIALSSDEAMSVTLSYGENAKAPIILDDVVLADFLTSSLAGTVQKGQVVILSKIPYTYVGDTQTDASCYMRGCVLSDVYATEEDDAHSMAASQYALNQLYQNTAPTSHASVDGKYGVGTSFDYGHLKLSNSVTSDSGTTGGIAATPQAVKYAYEKATEAGEANTTHANDKSNPHAVTKSQVGLGSVDNTSDANKPVSTAQAALIKSLSDSLTSESTRATNAESNLSGSISAEATRATNAENALSGSISAEVTRATNAENSKMGLITHSSTFTYTNDVLNVSTTDPNNEANKPKYTDFNATNCPSGFTNGWRYTYYLMTGFVMVYLIGFKNDSTFGIWQNAYNTNYGGWVGWREIINNVTLDSKLSALQSNFQAGVDSVYSAVVSAGTTPSSKSLADVVTGIGKLSSVSNVVISGLFKNNGGETTTIKVPNGATKCTATCNIAGNVNDTEGATLTIGSVSWTTAAKGSTSGTKTFSVTAGSTITASLNSVGSSRFVNANWSVSFS